MSIHCIIRSKDRYNVIFSVIRATKLTLISQVTVVICKNHPHKIDIYTLLSRLPKVIIIEVKNYGWSKAINRALVFKDNNTFNSTLILSSEILIENKQLNKMHEDLISNNLFLTYAKVNVLSGLIYPRNTCALWRNSIFQDVGVFDKNLDLNGGMEDFDMAIRIYLYNGSLPYFSIYCDNFAGEYHYSINKRCKEETSIYNILRKYPKSVRFHFESYLRL